MAKKYVMSDETFINPYNFVELDEKCDKKKRSPEGNLTGWIECTLEAKTPLFIPDTSFDDVYNLKYINKENEEKKIKSYRFFSYTDGKPVIPGSEIRGVIRSAFETVTNSCLSTINDDETLYKRTTYPGQPGRLYKEGGKWFLQPCDRVGLRYLDLNKKYIGNTIIYNPNDSYKIDRESNQFVEGELIYFKVNKNGYVKIQKKGNQEPTSRKLFDEVAQISKEYRKEWEEGYYHKGENFANKKHHESVFVYTQEARIEIDKSFVEDYRKNLQLYKEDTINQCKKNGNHKGYSHINEQSDSFLIYYNCINKNEFYFSPAAIGREIFHNKLNDILGNYAQCENRESICPACNLFGLVSKDISHASRVRFTDALPMSSQFISDECIILNELASPKLSATEFYLKRPSKTAKIWNYDYAIKEWKRENKTIIPEFLPKENYIPQIRGRKYYWHQKSTKKAFADIDKASDRNVGGQILKSGEFAFKVYFDGITREELDKLLWVLEIGGRKSNAHKIGMGKPLGLGSIKINVTAVKERVISVKDGTISYEIKDVGKPDYKNIQPGSNKNILEQFLTITDFDNCPAGVSYPQNESGQKTYEWFVANKQINGTGTAPVIEQILESIKNPKQTKYKECKDYNHSGHSQQNKGNNNNRYHNHKKY